MTTLARLLTVVLLLTAAHFLAPYTAVLIAGEVTLFAVVMVWLVWLVHRDGQRGIILRVAPRTAQ